MDITTLEDGELYKMHYTELAKYEQSQQNIRLINAEIDRRVRSPLPEPTPEEPDTDPVDDAETE